MEDKRKLIHIGMVSFALLLRWLTWWQAALCAVAAVLVNVFVMPRIGTAAFRDDDLKRGYAKGMVYYSLSVLILILTTPLPVAAAAWAIMAFGDGFASVVGIRWGTKKWPWSDDKSIIGTLGFIVAGTIGAGFFYWFTHINAPASTPVLSGAGILDEIHSLTLLTILTMAAATSTVLGVIETLPVDIDDNLSVPLGAGVVLTGLTFLLA